MIRTLPIKEIERASNFEIVAQDRQDKVVLMELDPLLIIEAKYLVIKR